MSKDRTTYRGTTRKHIARAQREQMYRQWLLVISIFLGVVVVGLVGYAIYDYGFVRPNTVVATINDDEVTSSELAGWARMAQADLVNQIEYLSLSAQYGLIGPDQISSVQQQVDSMVAQLENNDAIAQAALDRMVEYTLVRQKLDDLGIELDPVEIERQIQEGFNYFAQGTATAPPTRTPDVQRTSVYETAVATLGWPTATEIPTRTPTSEFTEEPTAAATEAEVSPEASAEAGTPIPSPTIRPTATEYTQAGYEQLYRDTIAEWENLEVPEDIFRIHLLRSYYTQLLVDYFKTQIEPEAEQVLLMHIVVADEETAQEVLQALDEGQTWPELAAQYSTDMNTSFFGGDLGWNTLEDLGQRFEYSVSIAAFSGQPGDIIGPVPGSDGFHLFWVLDRGTHPLTASQQEDAAQAQYNAWLSDARANVQVEILSDLAQWVPSYRPLVQQ